MTNMVKRQIQDVALTTSAWCCDGKDSAVAYAMAPRRPAHHSCSKHTTSEGKNNALRKTKEKKRA